MKEMSWKSSRDQVEERSQPRPTSAIRYNMDDVKVDELLGRGAHGSVCKGSVSGRTVAVKRVDEICKVCAWSVGVVIPELEVKDEIHHPNLVQIYGVHMVDKDWGSSLRGSLSARSFKSCCSNEAADCSGDQWDDDDDVKCFRRVIVMEYCDEGNLWDAVKRGEFCTGGVSGAPDYKLIIEVAMDVVLAMGHLHDRGIVHGDLTAKNVLLSSGEPRKKFVAKVGGYDCCCRLHPTGDEVTTTTVGTVDHMAPETLHEGKLHKPTDVFSFGITLFEMIAGRHPFLDMTPAAILVAIVEGMRPKLPPACPINLASLIHDCWEQNWQHRPSFGSIWSRLLNAVQ